MTRALPAPPLLVITDRLSAQTPLPRLISEVLEAGCRWLMVREKDMGVTELAELAKNIVDRARPFGACVMVNGNAEAARLAGADGVHLQKPEKIGPARAQLGNLALIGISAHSLEEAQAAAGAGANYVTMSPVFLTDSKPGYGPALGIAALADICRHIDVPVVALAGITPTTFGSCLDAGAAAVAVMGTVMRSDNPGATVREYLRAIERRG